MKDATTKRSVLVIISLAIALLAALSLIFFKWLAVSDHDDGENLVGIVLSILLTSVGIIIGIVAFFRRRRRRFGYMGLTGLTSSLLLLAIAVFMLLKDLVEGWLKMMSAVH